MIPTVTEVTSSLDPGQFVKQNNMAVVAFVISFSLLVAAIVGFGKKKE